MAKGQNERLAADGLHAAQNSAWHPPDQGPELNAAGTGHPAAGLGRRGDVGVPQQKPG
jgi:hypothetical protein